MANYTKDADAISRLSSDQFESRSRTLPNVPLRMHIGTMMRQACMSTSFLASRSSHLSTNSTATVAGLVSPNPWTLKTLGTIRQHSWNEPD